MSDDNTTLRPQSPLNKKTRESGFYWVRFSNLSEYEIAKWVTPLGWAMFWTEQYLPDHKLFEIDERRITREEPIAAKISGTTERIAQNE